MSCAAVRPGDGPTPRRAGFLQVWLDGSFVTAKDEPADFDARWDTTRRPGCAGPLMLELAEFFRNERDTGRKGTVLLSIGDTS